MIGAARPDSGSGASTDLGERVSRFVFAAFPLVPAVMLAIGAWRQRWMDDDGFINLRVVRNILEGHGPVFNLGERVEVCTSPLWTALLTLLGALGLPLEWAAVTLGITLSVAAMVLAAKAANRFQERIDADADDALAWPIGLVIFAVLPPAWDYASSGLETGLSLVWLAGSYLVVARLLTRAELRPRSRGVIGGAFLFGLGPLIRPELALYSAAWFLPLLLRLVREERGSSSRAAGSIVRLAVGALALPLAYEIFRMGYYGTVTPNTAIAKEAFRFNWSQGFAYFNDFVGVYAIGWPAVGVAVFMDTRLRTLHADKDSIGAVAAVAPPIAGLIHMVYIVAMGGDYMHGRMFLPPAFAIILPVAVVRLRPEARWMQAALAGTGLMIAVWVGICAARLRHPKENIHDVGDERAWYVHEAEVSAPVSLAQYRKHSFYKSAQGQRVKIEEACPSIEQDGVKEGEGCRALYLDDDDREKDIGQIAPQHATYALAPDTDPRVGLAVPNGAIGIFGYLLPDAVHVIDRHGLAEPLVSHLALGALRGRPGHEKMLGDAWLLARYAAPTIPDDARVTAARRALACGDLHALLLSSTAPLSWSRFAENFTHAFANTSLRIPADAFDAEARFCGTPLLPSVAAGGTGGDPFRWQCPEGSPLVALRGEVLEADKALSRVRPICAAKDGAGAEVDDPTRLLGPWLGRKKKKDSDPEPAVPPAPFEVACPAGSVVTGLFGMKGDLVQGVGLRCEGGEGSEHEGPIRTAAAGILAGTPFDLTCKAGSHAIGVVGRAGSLIDQLGVVCQP